MQAHASLQDHLPVGLQSHQIAQCRVLGIIAKHAGMKQVAEQVFAIQRGDLGRIFGLQRGLGLLDFLPELLEILAGDAARFRADGQVAADDDAQGSGGIASSGKEHSVEQGQFLAQIAARGAGVDHLAVELELGHDFDQAREAGRQVVDGLGLGYSLLVSCV